MNKVNYFYTLRSFSVCLTTSFQILHKYILSEQEVIREISEILNLPQKTDKANSFFKTCDRIRRFQSNTYMIYLFSSHLEKLKLVGSFHNFPPFLVLLLFFLILWLFSMFLSFFDVL